MLNRHEFDSVEYIYYLFQNSFDGNFESNLSSEAAEFLNSNEYSLKKVNSDKINVILKALNKDDDDLNYNLAIKFTIKTSVQKNKKTSELSPESYIFLEYINEILKVLSKENGLIFDVLSSKFVKYFQLTEKSMFPKFDERISFSKIKKNGSVEIHTHGLNKYGIPDIQTQDILNEKTNNVIMLIKFCAKKLLFYDKLEYTHLGYNLTLEQMHNSNKLFDKPQLRLTFAKQ